MEITAIIAMANAAYDLYSKISKMVEESKTLSAEDKEQFKQAMLVAKELPKQWDE